MQMLFNCPLSSSKADQLVEVLDLNSNCRVLDVGCGTGEFLTRVVSRFDAIGVGIDIHSESLAAARAKAADEAEGRIVFEEIDVRSYEPEEQFDCGICMGATHAFAMDAPAYPEALRGLSRLIRPGGKLLIGESYWMQSPAEDYLRFIGEPVGTYRTHNQNVELASDRGLIPYYIVTSSLDEWDDFEWSHNIRLEKQTAMLDDDAAEEMRKRSRAWRSAYLRWGRGTMGFAYYVFLNGE